MADHLEDDKVDCDRILDHNSFLNDQFDIFTHDYREKKEPESSCDDCSCNDSKGNDNRCKAVADSKARVINTGRKLRKSIVILESMPNSEPISDMISVLKDVLMKLNRLTGAEEQEFTTTSVQLPEYDQTDMELFLGENEAPQSTPMLELLEQQNTQRMRDLDHVLAEADIMLLEVDHLRKGITS